MKTKISFKEAYFIRLGQKSSWANYCFKNKVLKLGYKSHLHKESLKGNWDVVTNFWIDQGKTPGKAKDFVSQIRKFYESRNDILWITFHDRKLYWCFSEKKITELEDQTRERPVIGGWHSQDIDGNDLTFDKLSTKLTKTQGYQGTICNIQEIEYLKRKINNIPNSFAEKAAHDLENLKKSIEPLIKELTWYDFELLIDLIFTYSGWRRIETLGKTQKSIDIDLLSPVNGIRAFVQVKSASNSQEFLEYKEEFEQMDQYKEFYYFVHTWKEKFAAKELYTIDKIASLVINSGLTNWLIEKTR